LLNGSQQSDNLQSYVNATFVELFGVEPKLREKAKSLGLPNLLDQIKRRSSPEIAEQIDYVLRTMAGRTEYVEGEEVDDEEGEKESFEAYEEVGDNHWEFPLEGEELLARYAIAPDGAQKMKQTIDSSLRQSIGRLSVSLQARKSGKRGPAVGNVLARSIAPSALALGSARPPSASAPQKSLSRSQHRKS